jgi:hypothetical protein
MVSLAFHQINCSGWFKTPSSSALLKAKLYSSEKIPTRRREEGAREEGANSLYMDGVNELYIASINDGSPPYLTLTSRSSSW